MKRYDAYKPSGIEWIGEVPKEWDKVHIKRTCVCKNGLFIDGDWIESKDLAGDSGTIRYLTSGNVGVIKYKEQGDGYITEEKFNELRCTEVLPGDILISRLNEPIGRACIVPDLNSKIVCAVDNVICRPDDSLYDRRYLVYQMNCRAYSDYTNCLARGTGMHRISRAMLGQISILVPLLPEQTAIADYLDAKCAKIDNVVAVQQKRIELLKELKQSIITHAVTKGLDKNAKMKDSGIEWIGKVPDSWEKCRFKNFVTLINKPTVGGNKIGLENIESGSGKFLPSDSEFDGDGVGFVVGDIVYGKLRPYLMKVWVAEFSGNAVGDFFVFRVKDNTDSAFVKYLMLSDGFTKEANGATEGAKMPRVSSDFILTLRYYLPPKKEQTAITEYLDKKCAKIDRQIAKVEKQIELLNEYKQSVITECVTGKRKVC